MAGNLGSSESLDAAATAFARDGYLVLREFCTPAFCDALMGNIRAALNPVLGPAEFEADVGYPGAPVGRDAPGGNTPRRLLYAYSRFSGLREFATRPLLAAYLRALMHHDAIRLSQCHHNCVMTKAPGYSSDTLWHQDIRYWAFSRPELVSVWVALGAERDDNGALRVIPGSHLRDFDVGQMDTMKFLRTDLPENQKLIESARTVELSGGDVLFFHCRTLHAAGRNLTDDMKLSCVFTYHAADNPPQDGSRSAQYPSVALPPA